MLVVGQEIAYCRPGRAAAEPQRLFDFLVPEGVARLQQIQERTCPLLPVFFLVHLPKFGIDGSQVAEQVAAGRIDEVARYCLSDVVQTFCLGLHVRHLAGWIDDQQLARGIAAVAARVRSEPLLAELAEATAPYFARWRRSE